MLTFWFVRGGTKKETWRGGVGMFSLVGKALIFWECCPSVKDEKVLDKKTTIAADTTIVHRWHHVIAMPLFWARDASKSEHNRSRPQFSIDRQSVTPVCRPALRAQRTFVSDFQRRFCFVFLILYRLASGCFLRAWPKFWEMAVF